MKTADAGLISFMNSAKQGAEFDLWTIALQSGTILRWTNCDVPVKLADGRIFTLGPVCTRDLVRWVRGVQVDTLQVTFKSPTQLIDGQLLPAFAALGGFDAAIVGLERAYFNDSNVLQGSLEWFPGLVADVDPSDMGATLYLKSQLTQLTQQIPKNLYQTGCLNNLYDSTCGVNRAALTVSTTVLTVPAPTRFTSASLGYASGYFDLGILKFTSGANAGISRTVQTESSGSWQLSRPFQFIVAPGDTFTVTPGCDKTYNTCLNKFNNLVGFRGVPFVPVPETVT